MIFLLRLNIAEKRIKISISISVLKYCSVLCVGFFNYNIKASLQYIFCSFNSLFLLSQVKTTYRSQLNNRETQYAEMHAEMLKELHCLREELRKGGRKIPDINYDFELMGECPTLLSPPVSPPLPMAGESVNSDCDSVKTELLVKVEGTVVNQDLR